MRRWLYFQDALGQHRNDGKATWDLLNQVINKKNKTMNKYPDTCYDNEGNIYREQDIPEGFNTFFSSVGQVLDRTIPKTEIDPMKYLNISESEECRNVPKVTEIFVERLIKSLNSVGGGIDKISTKILLGTYKSIIHHLVFFFNLCLETAVFPDNLKVAIITPIHKGGPKDCFTNYRPISLLPIFSKILEKILHATISSYLEESGKLYPYQFGFRKKHSTYMPIAHMHDAITKNLEENEITCILYLDLKKAFDTVCIEILMNKIQRIGIRGPLYQIIASYLDQRYQLTKINNVYSKKQNVTMGAPQGSILGPLLFILYINDLPNVSDLVKFYIFADDTAVMIKACNQEELQSKIDRLVPIITEWFQANRLSLNASKSNYQVFSKSKVSELNMILQNTKVERKTTVKYLGMYVDENLKWHNHIAYVVSTISRNLGVICRAKYLLTSRELTLLYNTLILPHLNYCAVVWGRNYDSNTKRIMLLQKRAVRIIDKKPFLYPSSQLFVKHKILKFHDIVKEQSIMILLAHVNNTLPSPISKLFEYEEHKNTRSVKHFVTPLALRNYRLFALSCSVPRIWNTIITPIFRDIKDVPSNKALLKKQVRKCLFKKY